MFERLKHSSWGDPVGVGCWQNLEQSDSKMRREIWNYEIRRCAQIKSESSYNRSSCYRKYVLVTYRGFSLTVSLFWRSCMCIMLFGVGFQVKMTCPIQRLVTVEVNPYTKIEFCRKKLFVVLSCMLTRNSPENLRSQFHPSNDKEAAKLWHKVSFLNVIQNSSTLATPQPRDQLKVDQKTLRSLVVWGCKKVYTQFPGL